MHTTQPLKERRRRFRLDLHWPVQLLPKTSGLPVAATTRNLSTGGFYCLSDQPLIPGERLVCFIRMPGQDPDHRDGSLGLHCHVQVMRVEKLHYDECYGIACKIEDYKLFHGDHEEYSLAERTPLAGMTHA